jgi:hypothetical protein
MLTNTQIELVVEAISERLIILRRDNVPDQEMISELTKARRKLELIAEMRALD